MPDVVNSADIPDERLYELARNMAEGHFIYEHNRQGSIAPEALYVR